MNKKQWFKIFLVAVVFGTLGSLFCTRYLIPYLSTFGPLGFLRNLQANTPIIINRREEIRLDEGVSMADLVKQASPAMVTVYSGKGKDIRPAGSGIIVTSDGVIITNRQTAGNGSDITVVLNDGVSYPALLRALDPKTELAVLTIASKDLPVFQFEDAAKAEVGQKIVALGETSREFTKQFASGLVTAAVSQSASLEQVFSTEQIMETFSTDASLTPAFSGGPVVNLNGRLLGIVAENGKIITSEAVQGALNSYLSQAKITRPFWGVRYLSISKSLASLRALPGQGALVQSFDEGSPAAVAGVLANDLITKVNGTEIGPLITFEGLANSKSGEVVLTVNRGGRELEIKFNVQNR